MSVDIVIPTCKSYDSIRDLIDEIERSTPEQHRIIATCQMVSASKNRNYALKASLSEIIVMMDDDMTGFYPGWLSTLIEPMIKDASILVCSSRLLSVNKIPCQMMGGNAIPKDNGVYDAENKRVATACIAIRRNDVLFDEGFIGSGYEDTCYMRDVASKYPDCRIVVNNDCRLIHNNEEKNQGGKYFEHNKAYYLSRWPDDEAVKNQKDWTNRPR